MVVVTAVGLAGWAAGWFTTYVLDEVAVEQGVRATLTEHFDIKDIGAVECPGGQRITPGHTFTCTVVIGEQRDPAKVRVTVENEEGRYVVHRPS